MLFYFSFKSGVLTRQIVLRASSVWKSNLSETVFQRNQDLCRCFCIYRIRSRSRIILRFCRIILHFCCCRCSWYCCCFCGYRCSFYHRFFCCYIYFRQKLLHKQKILVEQEPCFQQKLPITVITGGSEILQKLLLLILLAPASDFCSWSCFVGTLLCGWFKG